MNLLFLFLTGITIGISGAMIPGPLTIFTISATLQTNNKFTGLRIILGHIILEFVFITVVLLGFQKFLSSKEFLRASSIIGSIALILMGILLLLNAAKIKLSDIKGNCEFNKGLILGGVFFSVISPGFLIWWATIGISTIVKALLSGIFGVVMLTLGHWLADTAWYASLSYAVNKGRMYLTNKSYQNIMRLFAALLILLGLRFYLIQPT
ncbi:MAG: LysE family transporter [Candidatus Omnitrophica bacterium]|nr:LysE family transporter [Candidatus Omnitrophota bacterium]